MINSSADARPAPAAAATLAREIEEFLVDRRARQLSPRTIAWYDEKLRLLARFAVDQGVASLQELTPALVRRYLLDLAETHNPGGVDGMYRALRALVNWYGDEFEPAGWRNPLRKVRPPKVPERVLEPVSLRDLEAMLTACPGNTELGCRDRAILLGLLDTGCRASEFLALCLGDVDFASGACQVCSGKGGKPRMVRLGEQARTALQAYLARRSDLGSVAPLWATRTGTRLTYSGLREIMRRRARRAGVTTPSLHAFRRGFALGCLRSGMDIFALQRLMGHADISILRRYLAQTHEDLLRAHMEHSPVDGLFGQDTDGPPSSVAA
jgi:integrase/recombinase XerD